MAKPTYRNTDFSFSAVVCRTDAIMNGSRLKGRAQLDNVTGEHNPENAIVSRVLLA